MLSDSILRTLQQQFAELAAMQAITDDEWSAANTAHAKVGEKFEQATLTRADCATLLDATPLDARSYYFPLLQSLRVQALGQHTLSVESCENREKDFRDFLQAHIDTEDKKIARLRDAIIGAMQNYTRAWPLDSREVEPGHLLGGRGEPAVAIDLFAQQADFTEFMRGDYRRVG